MAYQITDCADDVDWIAASTMMEIGNVQQVQTTLQDYVFILEKIIKLKWIRLEQDITTEMIQKAYTVEITTKNDHHHLFSKRLYIPRGSDS